MPEKEGDAELDELIDELSVPTDNESDTGSADAAYPLPEQKPVKYTNVDVVVMPHGYKSEYPKPGEKKGDTRPRFSDSTMKLDLDSISEEDGKLSVPAVIANAGHIYDYDGLKAVKPFDELEAAAQLADGIPVTCEHPEAGIVTDRAEVLGFLKNPAAEDNMLKGILEITGKDLIADIKDGKRIDVSSGYFCDLDSSDAGKGNIDGNEYDATQRNIFLNHIAVCEQGRCTRSDGCGLDMTSTGSTAASTNEQADALSLKKNKEVKAMLREVEDAELLKGQNHAQITEKGFYAVERVRELYGGKRKVVICYDAKIAASKNRERDEKLKRAEEELSAYRAKLAGGITGR